MKAYIGRVYEDGHISMLDDKIRLIPHIKGGLNTEDGETLVFKSYYAHQVNLDALKKKNLRFLTKEEAALFMAGKDANGNNVASPKEEAKRRGWI